MFLRWGKRTDRLCSFWKCHNVVHTAGTIRKTACHVPHKIFISEWILSSSRITGEIKFKCFRHIFSEWDFRIRPETVAHHFTMSEANSRCRNKRCHYIAISPYLRKCNFIYYTHWGMTLVHNSLKHVERDYILIYSSKYVELYI